ncbi:hypothetical protein MM326_15210 [Alkalihalobacillus sp. LMS6]|uniref:hypothetical protein n=1 Tax=Alkalihalobacillus sp. LMS6 TaxID=2924034 RepID=UPI0020D06DCE|nr:hypothetical protein [Alkalihalobacillus sp. LMS6]UTR05445.1 hypothetical protein MM326_15210 [Alkalihalobacillus sp. LMS6]
MERPTNQQVTVIREMEVIQTANREKISAWHHEGEERYVEVRTELRDLHGLVLNSISFRIEGEEYELLMSDRPEFSPNKPKGDFSGSDLWHFVDLYKERINR